jgi:DNA-binding SARP family transcriptional activator
MQPNTNLLPKIEVKMLGEFSISINGNQLTNLKGRTKRVWMLIEYLIANRKKDVSLEKLVEVLWEEDECGDPLNALKNLIYRAREILKKLSIDENADFIQFVRNTYSWNNYYDCIIDTEQFIDCWKLVNDSSKPADVRIHACKEALALYRGEFLPKSSYSAWVISAAAYYTTLYTDCVLNGCGVLIDSQHFSEVIHICETALTYVPLEESIHKLLIFAYISSSQRNKALDHYNYTTELFYKELGVDISESLRPLYKQLINNIDHVEFDLGIIKGDLKEVVDASGAYYCDYDVFKSIYRVQARMAIRTGLSIFIVLFTLSDGNGDIPEPELIKLTTARLKEAILSSLRKGDAVASYSSSQFIAMLPLISYENAQMVSNRISQKFRFLYRKDNIRVTIKINALDAIE